MRFRADYRSPQPPTERSPGRGERLHVGGIRQVGPTVTTWEVLLPIGAAVVITGVAESQERLSLSTGSRRAQAAPQVLALVCEDLCRDFDEGAPLPVTTASFPDKFGTSMSPRAHSETSSLIGPAAPDVSVSGGIHPFDVSMIRTP